MKNIATENDAKDVVHDAYKALHAWSYAPIQTGRGVHGIPDRVGCVPVTITQAMVGRTIGMFVGVEAKAPGRRGEKNAGASALQVGHLEGILAAGGVALLADSIGDVQYLNMVVNAIRSGWDHTPALQATLNERMNNG